MTGKHKRPIHKTKKSAQRHGAIRWGSGNYVVRKRVKPKKGWSAYPKEK